MYIWIAIGVGVPVLLIITGAVVALVVHCVKRYNNIYLDQSVLTKRFMNVARISLELAKR